MVSLLQSLHTFIIHDRIITLTRAKNGIRICAYLCVQSKSDAFKNHKITSHFMHVWLTLELWKARLFKATPNIYQHIRKPNWRRLTLYTYYDLYIYHIILIHINNSISITSRKLFHLQILFLVKCTHKSMIRYTKMQTRKWGARENTKMSKQIETVTTSIELV